MKLDHIEHRMDGAITALSNDLNALRAGHPHPSLLDSLTIKAYGAEVGLKQLATVSTADNTSLVISVFDSTHVKAIEKAILTSDLSLTPHTISNTIRLNFPQMTQERRKELVKIAHKYAEQAKVSLRNIRRDTIDDIKHHFPSKDEQKRYIDKVQSITDTYSKKIETMLASKESQILTL